MVGSREADSLKKLYKCILFLLLKTKFIEHLLSAGHRLCSAGFAEKSERGSHSSDGDYPPHGMGQGRQSAGK